MIAKYLKRKKVLIQRYIASHICENMRYPTTFLLFGVDYFCMRYWGILLILLVFLSIGCVEQGKENSGEETFKIYNVGEVVTVYTHEMDVSGKLYDSGEMGFKVNSVSCKEITTSFRDFEDSKNCIMDITIINQGDSKVNWYFSFQTLAVLDSEGYTYNVVSSSPNGLDYYLDLYPNEKMRGNLAVELPNNAIINKKIFLVGVAQNRMHIALN